MVFRRNCDLSQFENYLDLSRFQYFLTAVSNNEVALVNNRYLIVTWIYDDFLSKSDPVRDDIQLALEFDDDTYTASAICWLTNDTICVGFLSGIVAVFSTAGEELLEFTGRNTSVQALRKSPPSSSEDYLWILYEDSYLVSVSYDSRNSTVLSYNSFY